MNDWPVFKSHDEALCFLCELPLKDTPTRTDFAVAVWKQKCGECHLVTHYDIEPKENER